jgi:hypothetical protein
MLSISLGVTLVVRWLFTENTQMERKGKMSSKMRKQRQHLCTHTSSCSSSLTSAPYVGRVLVSVHDAPGVEAAVDLLQPLRALHAAQPHQLVLQLVALKEQAHIHTHTHTLQ